MKVCFLTCLFVLSILPMAMGADVAPRPIQVSTFEIPLSVPLSVMLSGVEAHVPAGEDATGAKTTTGNRCVHVLIGDVCGDAGYTFRWRRDPLNVSVSGNTLTVNIHLYYGAEGFVCVDKPWPFKGCIWKSIGKCGFDEPEREITASIVSKIDWDDKFTFVPTTTFHGPAFVNDCRISFLSINLNGRIGSIITDKLKVAVDKMNEKIAARSFHPQAAELWTQLRMPQATEDPNLWLVTTPVALGADPINGSGQTLRTTVRLAAVAQVVNGTPPTDELLGPSAPPDRTNVASENLQLLLDGAVTFADASKSSSEQSVGKKFQTPAGAVEVADVWVQGTGNRVAVFTSFKGGLRGTIRADGELAYDEATTTLYMRDLKYSIATSDTLTQEVFDALMGDAEFTASVQAGARWPVTKQIDLAKKQATKALNREIKRNNQKIGTVSGSLNGLHLADVFAVPSADAFPESADGRHVDGWLKVTLAATGAVTVQLDALN